MLQLDFISRLMWQAQLLGNKTWNLVPSPECESTCQSFSFYVEPGDASKSHSILIKYSPNFISL